MNLAETDKQAASQEEKEPSQAQEPLATGPAAEPAAPAAGQKAPKAKGEKKKGKDKKAEELEALSAELDRHKELLLRTAAEFDNFKRRTEKERLAAGEYVKAQTLKGFLSVLDNIDRAQAAGDGQSPEEYAKGVGMILKQFSEAMQKAGLTEIEAEGQVFDPNLHEAVMHVEDEEAGENTVIQVLQKGYKVGETVVRPAMVKVAN